MTYISNKNLFTLFGGLAFGVTSYVCGNPKKVTYLASIIGAIAARVIFNMLPKRKFELFTQNFEGFDVFIQNNKNENFSISSVEQSKELTSLPKELTLDYRLSPEDTSQSLSYLKKLALDSNYTRSEVFLMKKDQEVIGISTLFIIPYKNLNEMFFLTVEKNQLFQKPLSKIIKTFNPNTYVILLGWSQILPQYRGRKLASNSFQKFLLPKIKRIIKDSNAEIYIMFSAKGLGNRQLKSKFNEIWSTDLSKSEGIDIDSNININLGQVHPGSVFTYLLAQKNQIPRINNCYNFSLGPVFFKSMSR